MIPVDVGGEVAPVMADATSAPLRCRCGTVKGAVAEPSRATRGICYCKHCQAYAHALGDAAAILDAHGGTEIVATLPRYVVIKEGFDALACLSLTENGLLRWYASCCNTPIGNTPRNFKLSFVGLVHSCLEDRSGSLESSFGPIRNRVNRSSAKGEVESMPLGSLLSLAQLSTSLVRARLDGSYRETPFFDTTRGTPIVAPRVLTGEELARAMNAVRAVRGQARSH